MSDQTKEFSHDRPPRQGPETPPTASGLAGGNLITMYQAQQGDKESFPVLQAFQEYIEAERKQARKRVVQLSVSFAFIIGVVVVGFLAAGVYIMQNMTNKLFDVMSEKNRVAASIGAPAQAQVPAVAAADAQSATVLEASLREMTKALAAMQATSVEKKADKRAEDPELELLKSELMAIKAQNNKLEGALGAMRIQSEPVAARPPDAVYSKVVADALAAARRTAVEKEASDQLKSDKVAEAAAENGKIIAAQQAAETKTALDAAALRAAAERAAQAQRKADHIPAEQVVASDSSMKRADLRYPAADKVPPLTPEGVVAPRPPKDMKVVSVPLKTRKGGEVPWRVFLPAQGAL